MSSFSRRDFMVRSAATAGALALRADQLFAADAPVDMAITKWAGSNTNPSHEEIGQIATKLTEKAIEGMGGLKRFVKPGSTVWVKPNIGWERKPEYAANTTPEVVATVVRLCFDAGAKTVKVGDYSCHKSALAYPASGIPTAVQQHGAEVLFLDPSRFKETHIGGEHLQSLSMPHEVLDCDLVINVPIVKHHVRAEATMCMKNYMGLVDDKRKDFHQNIAGCLVDLTRFMKPQICILDAVRILKAHGPVGGKLEDVETKLTVAAGTDIVALDAWGAGILGRKPTDIPSVVAGEKAGLGKMDYRSLNLREIAVS